MNELIQNNKTNNTENNNKENINNINDNKEKEESFEVKPELNDVEEENLKEIAGLMRNLLEE